MKPHLLKVPLKAEHSFSIRKDIVPYFFNYWNYHPEIELVHIHKGSGTQFIGNTIEYFMDDEMIIVGSNLPHMWRSDKKYYRKNSRLISESTVVHFQPEFIGAGFLQLPENNSLQILLEQAKRGIKITGKTKQVISDLMKELLKQEGTKRIITLLTILDLLAKSTDKTLMNPANIQQLYSDNETTRLNYIYQYILSHFTGKISLNQIAAIANMNPNAFCRYFKDHTKKTFTKFLMEVRISYSCKLLLERKHSISEVCEKSGYHNFSNFSRQFKIVTKKTPFQYQKEYLQNQA